MKTKLKSLSAIAGAIALAAIGMLALFGWLGGSRAAAAGVRLAAAPDVAISGIVPASALNDVDTPVTISGSDFAVVTSTLTITTPSVLLNDTPLPGVTWVSSTQLLAVVPWGLPSGVYSVTVVNPGGASASLAGAFTVTQGIGTWVTGGPYGGEIPELVLHPVLSGTVYALAFNVGLFASGDAANTWAPMRFESWPTHLAIDPHTPAAMYLGSSFGLYRTLDGGQTWTTLALPGYQPNWFVQPVAHPLTAGVVYAGLSPHPGNGSEARGLFRSTNYGSTWITATAGMTDTAVTALEFYPDDATGRHMVAGTITGNVFVSVNGGTTWQWAAHPASTITRLYVNPLPPHDVWVLPTNCCQPPSAPYLLKSLDAGLTQWQSLNVAGDWQAVRALAFDSQGTVWAGVLNADAGVYSSTDGGQTWSPQPASPREVAGLAIDPQDESILYAGVRCGQQGNVVVCGVYKSTDHGLTWQQQNAGLAGLSVEALAATPGDPDRVYAYTDLGLLASDTGGHSWQELGIFKIGFPWAGSRLAVDPFTTTRLYLGSSTDYGQASSPVVKMGDANGSGWQSVTLTKPGAFTDWCGDAFAVAPHPARPGRILAGVTLFPPSQCFPMEPVRPLGLIYASDDDGATWTQMTTTQPISGVLRFAYDAVNPDLVYAATDGTGLLRSTDGGGTWHLPAAWPPGAQPCDVAQALVTHPTRANAVYLDCKYSSLSSEAFRSTNAGASWTPMPLPASDALLWVPSTPPVLYAGSRWGGNGLFRSTDDGQTWSPVNGLAANAAVFALAAARDAQRVSLYVALAGGGGGTLDERAQPAITDLMNGGVYRNVTPEWRVYLPLLRR